MNTSQKNSVLSQIESDEPLPPGTLAYLSERVRNDYYDYVLARLRDQEKHGLTKAKLARRIGKSPDRISHLLGSPGNWTLDTITELLVGICREELTPQSKPYLGRVTANHNQQAQLHDFCTHVPPTTATSKEHEPASKWNLLASHNSDVPGKTISDHQYSLINIYVTKCISSKTAPEEFPLSVSAIQ